MTDREFNLQHSGFAHEHPLIAIGVVLISSIVLGTSHPLKLAQYTRYSERFVRAVAANMQNSGLWTDKGYDFSGWCCGSIIPHYGDRTFGDHVLIGEGSLFAKTAKTHLVADSCLIFWQEKLV